MSTSKMLAQAIYAETKDSKIQAIKMLRERSGLGLKEAKVDYAHGNEHPEAG